MLTTDECFSAYHDGYEAAKCGRSRFDNPYDSYTSVSLAWIEGYYAYKADVTAKLEEMAAETKNQMVIHRWLEL